MSLRENMREFEIINDELVEVHEHDFRLPLIEHRPCFGKFEILCKCFIC